MAIERLVPLSLLQTIGPAGRLASDIATHPEAAQAQSRALAEALWREQSQQIQRLEDPELSSLVDDEAQSDQQDALLQKKRACKPDTDEDEDTTASRENPFLGNVLNRKV